MRGKRLRLSVAIIAPIVLVALIVTRWSTVRAGLEAVSGADGEWLIIAASAAALTWVAASACQLGSTTHRLSVPLVFAVQVAGSFVNHVLPAGVGTAALNLRMLRRCGLDRDRAATAISINASAGFLLHGLALVVLLLAGNAATKGAMAPIVALAVIVVAAVVAVAVLYRTRFADRVRRLLAEARDVLVRPGRALLLWGGSGAVPLLHILVLVAVLHALGATAPVMLIAAAYLTAGAVAALVPSPGGFGSLDVALVASMTAAGVAPATAVSAVIGYRLLTVWIPLLPGVGTLLVLLRRGFV